MNELFELLKALPVWQSHVVNMFAGEPYTAHRMDDGWWMLWHEPFPGKELGRWHQTEDELKSFIDGNYKAGCAITLANLVALKKGCE